MATVAECKTAINANLNEVNIFNLANAYEENNQNELAEFIRLSCKAKNNANNYNPLLLKNMIAKADMLFNRNKDAILGSAKLGFNYVFENGVLRHIEIAADKLLTRVDEIFTEHPINSVKVWISNKDQIKHILRTPQIKGISRLEIECGYEDPFKTLANNPLPDLKALIINKLGNATNFHSFAACAGYWTNLQTFVIDLSPKDENLACVVPHIIGNEHFKSRVPIIKLSYPIKDMGAKGLQSCTRLHYLSIAHGLISTDYFVSLGYNKANLKSIMLDSMPIDGGAFANLIAHARVKNLAVNGLTCRVEGRLAEFVPYETLVLNGFCIDDIFLAKLSAQSQSFTNLKNLSLSGAFTIDNVKKFLQTTKFKNVENLTLASRAFNEQALNQFILTLHSHNTLPKLKSFNIYPTSSPVEYDQLGHAKHYSIWYEHVAKQEYL